MPHPSDLVFPDPMRGAEQSYSNQVPENLPAGLDLRTHMTIEFYKVLLGRISAGMTKKEMAFQAIAHADVVISVLNEVPLPGENKY
jgi:hypothetical protein